MLVHTITRNGFLRYEEEAHMAHDIRREGDTITLISNDINFKQAIWGWADGGAYAMRYGKPTGPNRGDLTTWEWTFTPDDARQLIRDIDKNHDGSEHDDAVLDALLSVLTSEEE